MRTERELLKQSLDEMYNHLKQLEQEMKQLTDKRNEYYTTHYLPLTKNGPDLRSLDPSFHCREERIAHNAHCSEALDQHAENMTYHQMRLTQMYDEIKRLQIMHKDFGRPYEALKAAYRAQHHTMPNVGNSSPALFSLPSQGVPHSSTQDIHHDAAPSSPTNGQ